MRSIARAACASRPAASLLADFERSRPVERGVEFDRKPRAVVLHQSELLLHGRAPLVLTHAPVRRPLEGVDGGREPSDRHFNRFQGGFDLSIVTLCLRDG